MRSLLFLSFIISVSVTSVAQFNSEVTSEEARQIAEKFVACSGYANKRLTTKKCGQYRLICDDLAFPCGFLERKAFGFFQKQQNGETGWTIVFRTRGRLKSKTTGVAVTMDRVGRDVKIEKVKVFLRSLENKY
jgi:hypothetical protein